MKRRLVRSPWLLAAALLTLAPRIGGAQSADSAPEIRWEPYTGRAADGSALEGKLGRIRVPENRGTADGQTIELAFVLYESESEEPGPPIFFLAGGPGAPGVELCAQAATDPDLRLLAHGDVIGLDQRGTGLSRPNLDEGPAATYELPLDRAVGREEVARAYSEALGRRLEYWKDEGVDLAAYNTVESADDVDAVRAALGFDQIVPWGTSYGSHLALAYLRRHPEYAARAVLMKVEGPDHTWKLPSTIQRHLERLGELVAADPELGPHLPDLVGTVRGLLAQLAEQPVTARSARGGDELSVTIGPYDLQTIVATALGSARNLQTLPAALHMMAQGEWSHVVGFAVRNRRGGVGSVMGTLMDCASGASPARRARIERERDDPANLLGDAIAAPFYPATCAACGPSDLGEAFRRPFECDVPVLFVSGELDARTPPENVEAIRGGFSQAAHVVVRGAAHDERELMSPEYCALVNAFLRGEAVESTEIALPPLRFMPVRER